MLLADGRELLIRGMGRLGPNVGSIYSDSIVGENSDWTEVTEVPEGAGIAYRTTLTDPETFTTPVTGRAQWAAVPGIRIRPFAMYCADGFYDD